MPGLVSGFLGDYGVSEARLYLSREDQLVRGQLFGYVRINLLPGKAVTDREGVRRAVGRIVTVDGHFVVDGLDYSLVDIEEFNYMASTNMHFPGDGDPPP